MDDFDDFVVCPFCQHKNGDLWDHDWSTSDVVETSCGECGKDIAIGRHMSVTYHMLTEAPELPGEESKG